MRPRAVMVLLACLAVLVLAGCADSDKRSSDDNRFGGFYGGASIGGAAP